MATDINGRVLAIAGILTALDFPTSTWGQAWEVIKDDQIPGTVEDAGDLVDKLIAFRPSIVDTVGIVSEERTFEDPAFAEEQTFEDSEPVIVETQTKTTRSKRGDS
jgi:hypothetical protein